MKGVVLLLLRIVIRVNRSSVRRMGVSYYCLLLCMNYRNLISRLGWFVFLRCLNLFCCILGRFVLGGFLGGEIMLCVGFLLFVDFLLMEVEFCGGVFCLLVVWLVFMICL